VSQRKITLGGRDGDKVKNHWCRLCFAISGKSSAGVILLFELYPPLSTYNLVFVICAMYTTQAYKK